MAGFFGLFGSRTKYVDEPTETAASQGQEAYYLKPDDAKTFGNIEFMRKPNVIRRTFPKTASNQQGSEYTRQVSSIESGKVSGKGDSVKSVDGKGPVPNDDNSRRKNDQSLLPFLKMAREIKK